MSYVGLEKAVEEFEKKEAPEDWIPAVPVGSEVFATNLLASGLLRVVNRTALHFQLVGSRDNSILDEVWVTKDV